MKTLLSSVFEGILKASEIISFVLCIGGAMALVVKSGAINAALASVIVKYKDKTYFLIPVIMVAFALAGRNSAVFGGPHRGSNGNGI